MSERKPLFSKPVGESKRFWNNLHAGSCGGEICGLCGTEWPEGEDVIRGRFLGYEIVEDCCGRVFDIVFEELGDEITREYLKDFSENPLDFKFVSLLDYISEAIEKARQKAEKFLQESNIQEDIKKIKKAADKNRK